jgi:23S rRNA-/tRNA-specific pseudouridylate synthase
VRVVPKDHPDAMRAITLVRVLAKLSLPGDAAPLSLLAVTIKTGRTHQIRVHLASAGHPIAGDDKYGEPIASALAQTRPQAHVPARVAATVQPSGRRRARGAEPTCRPNC